MKVDIKKMILNMLWLSFVAISVGYVGRGLFRGDWNITRALQMGLILGISYPLVRVIMAKYGPNVKKG